MSPRDIPNIITVFRILLVGPVIGTLLQGRFGIALALFVLAGFSDAVDGFLARRYHWFSRLGAILDPVADKLLLVSTYVAMGLEGYLPGWLVGAVVGRDLVIVGGAAAYWLRFGELGIQPTAVSKLNTLLQILLVIAVFLTLWMKVRPDWIIDGLIYTVFITTLLSGLNYVWVWGRLALAQGEHVKK